MSPAVEKASSGRLSWFDVTIAIWFSGTLVFYTVTALRIRGLRKLIAVARPASSALVEETRSLAARMGLLRVPAVVTVPGRISPFLWGFCRRPQIVLPADLLGRLDDAARQAVIAHELAHLKRRDHWVRILEVGVIGLYWWNPMVWWVCRRLNRLEEECCDAWVTWVLPRSVRNYASSLITTVDFLAGTRSGPLPVAMSAPHLDGLKRRLAMIMKGSPSRTLSWAGRLAILATGSLLLPILPAISTRAAPVVQVDQHADESEETTAYSAGRVRMELEVKLRASVVRVTKELESRLRSIRAGARQSVLEAPENLQDALIEMRINDLVEQLVSTAPLTVQIFSRDVDLDGVVRNALAGRPRIATVSDTDREAVRQQIEPRLREGLERFEANEDRILAEMRSDAREGIRHASTIQREVLRGIDLERLIEEATSQAPPVVQVFFRSVDFPSILDDELE